MTEALPVVEQERPIQSYSRSVKKDKHPKNEDAIIDDPSLGLFAVFDGLGGSNAGEVASNMAAEMVRKEIASISSDLDIIKAEHELKRILREVDAAIHREGLAKPETLGEMGTTASILKTWTYNGRQGLTIGHIGDSRVYRFRSGTLQQITEDDNYLNVTYRRHMMYGDYLDIQKRLSTARTLDDLNMGSDSLTKVAEEAWIHRNVSGGLGTGSAEPTLYSLMGIQPGDIFILTTDGIHDPVPHEDIENSAKEKSSPQEIADDLILKAQKANSEGRAQNFRAKPDDMSVVVVKF